MLTHYYYISFAQYCTIGVHGSLDLIHFKVLPFRRSRSGITTRRATISVSLRRKSPPLYPPTSSRHMRIGSMHHWVLKGKERQRIPSDSFCVRVCFLIIWLDSVPRGKNTHRTLNYTHHGSNFVPCPTAGTGYFQSIKIYFLHLTERTVLGSFTYMDLVNVTHMRRNTFVWDYRDGFLLIRQ